MISLSFFTGAFNSLIMDWINDYKTTRYCCTPLHNYGKGTAVTKYDAIGSCDSEDMPSKKGGGFCFSGITANHTSLVKVRYIAGYKYDKPF